MSDQSTPKRDYGEASGVTQISQPSNAESEQACLFTQMSNESDLGIYVAMMPHWPCRRRSNFRSKRCTIQVLDERRLYSKSVTAETREISREMAEKVMLTALLGRLDTRF